MQVRWVGLFQNLLTLLSLILSKVQNVMGLGTLSCLRESPAGQVHTRVTFLCEDETSLRLYVTLWSQGMRLLACEVNTNREVIANYSTVCDRSKTEGDKVNQRFNLSVALSPYAPCVMTDAPSATRAGAKARRKRSWILPGTLWCGRGSKAVGYDQLGMFESADRCCREHDHCPHIIPAFTVNYGVFNPNFFSVSHCDCDQRFRQCLLDVNDTISNMVRYSFFKILRAPCFELKLKKRCTEMYWWGMCKVTKEAPYAIFKGPLSYNTSHASKYEKTNSSKPVVTKEHHVTEIKKTPKSKHKCVSKDPPRGDTFFRKKTKGCKRRNQRFSTVAPLPHITTSSFKTFLSIETKQKGHLKKKSARKGLFAHTTAHPEITIDSYLNATSTTQTTALFSKRPSSFQLTATTKTVTKQLSPEKEDAFLLQKGKSPLSTTSSPATVAMDLDVTAVWTTIIQSRKRDSVNRLMSAPTYHNNSTTKLKPVTQYFDGKILKQAYLIGTNINQVLSSETIALKESKDLLNETDNLLCESFKHIDRCKSKIPPLRKKYGLQNLDTKPAYHCDCTSRLADQILSFKETTLPPPFPMDFISENCFLLPKKKKCQHRKSCSGGFRKASDLLQALKEIEEKDSAGVRNSGKCRKARISVRLYKLCLRLRQKAMPPLT